jgi:hypothetical protein
MSMSDFPSVVAWRKNNPQRYAEQNRKYASRNYAYKIELKRFRDIDLEFFK